MFKVLDVGDAEWTARIAALPAERRDVHFGPRLLSVYEAVNGWKVGLGLTENNGEFIIQPLIVSKDGQLRHAYNFGGPVGSKDSNADLGFSHRVSLGVWKAENGVRGEYCTLNPFIQEHQSVLLGTLGQRHIKDTVWMDLTQAHKLRGTTRRLANKAQGAGVKIVQVDRSAIQTFHEMYTKTMERAQAAPHWFFDVKFFDALYRLCKPIMLFALVDEKPEAGCIILSGYGGPAYYHFAGSYGTFPSLGVNHALVMAAAEYSAKVLHCTKLHLGGGVTPAENDGLYIFKKGFSDLVAPVYTYEILEKGVKAA